VSPPNPPATDAGFLTRSLGVFQYTGRAVELVWTTSRGLFVAILALTLLGGLIPAGVAWVGKLIVDAVVLAVETGTEADRHQALVWVGLEAGLVALRAGTRHGLDVCNSLLRAQLGHRVNVLVLEKARTLSLRDFEDSELYDKMTRARREASSRPLSLVKRSFGLVQNGISLVTYGALLLSFSPWAVLLLALAAVPAFVAETRFAGQAFRLFKWRSPETRKQMYLEAVIAREDYAKEVKLLELGPLLVQRYRDIFSTLYGEDRDLTVRRGFWGYLLGLLSTAALYGAYGWIVLTTVARAISLGDMTMYLLVFKQGQAAFSAILSAIGGMYEDNLYLSNLYEFLEQPVDEERGEARQGAVPGDGLRLEGVGFTYPGASSPALRGVSLHIPFGQRLALVGHNGSGKTTLIKLLTRLYEPTEGRVLLDGTPLHEWHAPTLRARVGVIFQDFVRYQFKVGENIGVGDVQHVEDPERWAEAAQKGMAEPFIQELPEGYDTQLGRWFKDGRELSIGQWQKVALARAFMRRDADILVLDEPTAAMDAEAEAEIFQRLMDLTQDQIAVLISHRFSTVRMADRIVVLHGGHVVEQGDHASLMRNEGQYAKLFMLQARGYLED
jgi:ATP-binding cassette subfamily B protein